MGWKLKRIAFCDVCGHEWIAQVENPTICGSKKCRSTLWNKGGIDGRTKEARNGGGHSKKVARQKKR
jgi:hypothetical protein